MKKLILTTVLSLGVSFNALAGAGHDHGTSEFEKKGAMATKFELSDAQIKNLQINYAPAEVKTFYDAIVMPVVLKQKNGLIAQGFLLEGEDITKVAIGQKVKVFLDAQKGYEFEGVINSVDNMIDPRTRLYSVYATLNEALPKNWQGQKGNMSVEVAPQKEAVSVPLSALQGDFGYYYVFVNNGNTFEKREVEIGTKNTIKVEILHGVENGESVVTTGSYQLKYVSGNPIEEEPHDESIHDAEDDLHADEEDLHDGVHAHDDGSVHDAH